MRSFSNERRAVCFSNCSSSSGSNIMLRLSRVGYRNVYGRVDVAGCGAVRRLDPVTRWRPMQCIWCTALTISCQPLLCFSCMRPFRAIGRRKSRRYFGNVWSSLLPLFPDTATFQIVRASINASIIHRSHLSCMGRTPRKKGDVFLADFGVHGSMGDRYVIRLPDLNRNFSDNLLPVSIVYVQDTFFSRLKCTKCNFDWSCARELRGFSD